MGPKLDAQPEPTMSERCVTIKLSRYNELVEKAEYLDTLEASGALRKLNNKTLVEEHIG